MLGFNLSKLTTVIILSLLTVGVLPDTSYAQRPGGRGDRAESGDRGGRGDRGNRGGRGGWGGRGGRGGNDSENAYRDQDRREQWLRRMDRNGNGVLEEGEIDRRARGFIAGMAKEAGIEGKKEFRLSELMPSRFKQGEGTLAFGEAGDAAIAPGFGDDAKGSTDGAKYITSTEEERKAAEATADDLIRKYDKNRNRILEREEWTQISGTPANSDTNRDGKITKAELVNRLIVTRRARSQDKSRDDKPEKREQPSVRTSKEGPRSYRFVTAEERIPEAARSWITGKDKDGDGQVAMAEYSTSWNDNRVREFNRYDANSDGVITPEEYLSNK